MFAGMLPFCASWKHQKTSGFVMLLECVENERRTEMC